MSTIGVLFVCLCMKYKSREQLCDVLVTNQSCNLISLSKLETMRGRCIMRGYPGPSLIDLLQSIKFSKRQHNSYMEILVNQKFILMK